ncbi:MAG: UPF0182 family protein [Bacteroidota bacterium]|nr:UPF0182 family protein [Bacteroidota bacterium]
MNVRRILLYAFLTILAVLILLGILAGFITDLWWFTSLGFEKVFWVSYETRYLMWLIGFVAFVAFMGGNLRVALRSTQLLPADERFDRVVRALGRFATYLSYTAAVVLGLIMASVFSGFWMEYLAMTHAEPFGLEDPLFGRDIGYYIFVLPFLRDALTWCLAAVALTLAGTVLAYLIRQGVSVVFGRLTATRKARVHAAVLTSLLMVLIGLRIWIGRYAVLVSERSNAFFGAGYTDVHAQIPAAWIMTVLSLAAAAILAFSIGAGRWKRVLQTLGAYVAAALLIAVVYPAIVQKFIVNPNEQNKELEYIRNNIRYTRTAFALNRIEEKEINPGDNLTANDLTADSATIKNIMLWDYRPLASTLDQLQVIRLYYAFRDVDIDRYRLPDGSYRQVMLSARELNQDKLPPNARTWVNTRLVYTHGYGLGMSPVNVVTDEGLPEFFVKDIPPVSPVGLHIARPEIYFGEDTRQPVIVRADIDEFDYPLGDQNKMTRYGAEAGVPIGSLFRRLLYAIHFSDVNILISGYLGRGSRILYNRTIRERLRTIAPFLQYDEDPYLVVADGRLVWICDAYTVSDQYPYSRPVEGVNYIRNSVKAVVDAYDGSTRFYVFDRGSDPMIRVFENIFPTLFVDASRMPESIRAHVRYPQDLFDIQSSIYETYHMVDPLVFYNKEDLWNIANEKLQDHVVRMESYYVIMRLPGEASEEFIQMIPYTPNRRDNMIAWLCARSDSPNYGRMLVYKFPKQELTYGPMQVSARIDQDPVISAQLTLWNQQGSSVTRGNLLVIPIKEDLLYVQPVYLQATAGKLPELKRVIVSYGNRIAMEATLAEALNRVFGGPSKAAERPSQEQGITAPPVSPLPVGELARSALERYDRAMRYQREGDWAKYGEEIRLLRDDLERLARTSRSGSVQTAK